MPQPFASFVIFAAMRTGSNLLEETLKTIPGVTVHGEAFNPAFIAWPNRETHLGMTKEERDAQPGELLRRMRSEPGLNGFRYFPGHDARMLDPVIADRACAKVILTRNPAESYVSLAIARGTGQWKLSDDRRRKDGLADFDPVEFASYHDDLQSFHRTVQHAIQVSGQTAFCLDYEDLTDPKVLTGLARFLGLAAQKVSPAKSLVPQNPGALSDKVANPDAMAAALARLDPFGLTRTPYSEPRRGPSVSGYIAAQGAPLMFMPVRSGPTERIGRWLADFGGGTQTGFSQAGLRDWMRDHAPHRRFTVLRHPVVRAYAAFRAIFVEGHHPGLREQLALRQKIRLDPQSMGDPAVLRPAFARFIEFLKPNLKGQTAQRVEPVWASQSAILQGFGDFVLPDAVLREETLAEGLAQLCEALGIAMPPLAEAADQADLAGLYDDEIERLARAAYGRDYVTFGFTRFA